MLTTPKDGRTSAVHISRGPIFLLLASACMAAASGCGQTQPPPRAQTQPAPSAQTQPAPRAQTQPAPTKNFTIVKLEPSEGDLTALLKAEVNKAKESQQKPFVEFYADWCGPCKALRDSLADPRMIEAFNGTYIIQLDADAWESKLSGTGFSVSAIPVFFEIQDDGTPTGRSIDGGAWGANTPPNMAPPLKQFFKG